MNTDLDHRRDRRGCLTCRRRKKKCTISDDGMQITGKERCPPCIRLHLCCVWPTERALSPVTDTPAGLVRWRQSTPLDTPSIFTSPLQYDPVTVSSGSSQGTHHRRTALRYYVQSFASTLSTNEENNGFLSVLLPMAMESRPLLDALIAWSTSHLALHHDHFQVKALEDRSAALRSSACGLQRLSADVSVAICLVLTSMESILGNTNDWYRHLSAAALIIRSILSSDEEANAARLLQTAEGRWFLRNFAYHDILASVSLSRAMLIPSSTEWLLLQSGGHDDVVDTYLGLGCRPVAALGRVCTLSRAIVDVQENETLSAEDRAASVDQICTDLSNLETDLLGWQPSRSAQNEALLALAESYRGAALLCLYRTLRSQGLRPTFEVEKDIAHQVENVIRSMSRLPPGCLPECTLLFPLFIAGGETRNGEHQQAIQQRMQVVSQNRSFANVDIALDVLKEVWDVQSRTLPIDPARPYDWTCVLEQRNWELALS